MLWQKALWQDFRNNAHFVPAPRVTLINQIRRGGGELGVNFTPSLSLKACNFWIIHENRFKVWTRRFKANFKGVFHTNKCMKKKLKIPFYGWGGVFFLSYFSLNRTLGTMYDIHLLRTMTADHMTLLTLFLFKF